MNQNLTAEYIFVFEMRKKNRRRSQIHVEAGVLDSETHLWNPYF